MGGGGGGRLSSPDELSKLEQVAKDTLKKSAEPAKRNVFLSFASEDLDEVNLLRGQAKNEKLELEFNDWSVKEPFDSKNAEYIKRGIRERIKQSSVTVVYVSDHTADSKWVDWEIRESIAQGKGVVAVHKGTTPPSSLPPAIGEHKIPVVHWNHQELSKAIEQEARKRE